MVMVLYCMSAVWIALGAWIILYTPQSRETMKKYFTGLSQKIVLLAGLVFGILLIVAADESRRPWVFVLLGIVAVIKVVVFFINPRNLATSVTEWYFTGMSDTTQRFFGIVIIVLGTALLSWI